MVRAMSYEVNSVCQTCKQDAENQIGNLKTLNISSAVQSLHLCEAEIGIINAFSNSQHLWERPRSGLRVSIQPHVRLVGIFSASEGIFWTVDKFCHNCFLITNWFFYTCMRYSYSGWFGIETEKPMNFACIIKAQPAATELILLQRMEMHVFVIYFQALHPLTGTGKFSRCLWKRKFDLMEKSYTSPWSGVE